MFLAILLFLTLLVLATIVVVAVSIGGSAFILLFGDIIVCIVLIGLLIKHIIKRSNKKHKNKD